jgi:hypothetical protein
MFHAPETMRDFPGRHFGSERLTRAHSVEIVAFPSGVGLLTARQILGTFVGDAGLMS